MDPIADLFNQVKNASRNGSKEIITHGSNFKMAILKILKDQGLILNYEKIPSTDKNSNLIKISLKYDQTKLPLFNEINYKSRPGKREYVNVKKLSQRYRGKGILIISTSSGVMTGEEARKKGLGGELICEVN